MVDETDYVQSTAEQYLENRLEQYRSWYDNKAVRMKKKYQQAQAMAAAGAVLIPVINNVSVVVPIGNGDLDISEILSVEHCIQLMLETIVL